ncbi:hypothetical protein E3C22_10180 [Jiella endophytica]|uniref:Photosynthetic complex assembly protein n=1 Tax=Jiella endophytica TaxID=2558362 RepID=A0A4Y8RIH2_9HYPH|nr:photosynthetic complex assembly protein PuhC [Jiella endophytica]TFF22825.1 hypothetical protein E3C22_10180 [Jiella endophytica]
MRGLAAAIRNGQIKIAPDQDKPIPKPILIGAGALALTALVAIGMGRTTGIGLAETPEVGTVASRGLQIDEHADGSVAVIDASSREPLVEVAAGQGAFTVEVLRNLSRDRVRKGASDAGPFVLALKSDGRLVVEDPETRQQVELRAFGKLQAEAFAKMLPAGAGASEGASK